MAEKITLYGHPVSPFVRKVLTAFRIKGITPDALIPLTPFIAREELKAFNPLMRIPVLKQGDFILPDSTAICEYIDEVYPGESLYPTDAKARAKARWLEEYADDHIARSAIFDLFFQRVVRPAVLKEEPDQEKIKIAIEQTIPAILDYLESQLGATGFLVADKPYISDFAISSYFINAQFAGWQLDIEKWPKTAAYFARVQDHPVQAKVTAFGAEALKARREELEGLVKNYLAA